MARGRFVICFADLAGNTWEGDETDNPEFALREAERLRHVAHNRAASVEVWDRSRDRYVYDIEEDLW